MYPAKLPELALANLPLALPGGQAARLGLGVGPRTPGVRRAQGRGVAQADRWPAIGQPGCQGTGPRLDPRQPRVGASLGFFSLRSPERPPYGRSRGSARKINLAGELRPLSCYAFAKRWLLPQYCIMIFQPCLDHIILNY